MIRETLKQWDKDILDMQDMSTKFKQFSQLFSFFSVCVIYNLSILLSILVHTPRYHTCFRMIKENIKTMGQSKMKNQIFNIINVFCRLLDIVSHVTNNSKIIITFKSGFDIPSLPAKVLGWCNAVPKEINAFKCCFYALC